MVRRSAVQRNESAGCIQGVVMSRFPGADFEAYVREVGARLLRFAHVLTLDRAEAEDLAQETLIRVGLAWSRVRRDGNPIGYAQRTLLNLFLNRRRRRGEVPMDALPDNGIEESGFAAVD